MELINVDTSVYFLTFLLLCAGPYIVDTSRDLALNKTAEQSTTFDSFNAGRAVDGILGRDVTSGHCSHTGTDQQQAWWKVDLGQSYRIQMINITYRHDYTHRLEGYSLYVTNNTDMTLSDGFINEELGYLCYHDADSRIPTYNQSRQCQVDGRYVVFYNSRTNEDAYIELCGVQVYGCPTGRFGFKCRDTCHCQTGGCNPDTGQCDVTECQTGWMGLSCSLRCYCNSGGACDIDTGVCNGGGCQSVWSGRSCVLGPHDRDLARNKDTSQSSTFSGYSSDKAVDGIITAEVGPHGSCSHTMDTGQNEAWWKVDLGGVKRIGTINIIYRQKYTFRMSGFYLYISNSSYTSSQSLSRDFLCYHDHGPGLPSYIQSLSCPVSGRYVIFYNKRPADYEPFNRMYYSETNAVIELCEVQVLEACERGKFGQDCSQSCHCASSDCNQMTGTCLVPGCSAGWMGNSCDQACERGKFGQNCSQSCHCATSDCHKMTGECLILGCSTGWRGNSCDQECANYMFGRDCIKTCQCAYSGCNRTNGVCTLPGCREGWMGSTCSQACTGKMFGRDCNKTCHCANSDCDRRSGVCSIPGCTEGWTGSTCSQECGSNSFGRDCNQTCHCAYSDCDRRSGTCTIHGCTEGWMGSKCNQDYVNQTFGRDCNQTCLCFNSDCDRKNGSCYITGWCVNNTYGRDCKQTCHCENSDCDVRSGICKIPGCTEGWVGSNCSQGCVNNTYGRDCKQTCHCENSDCDVRSGICKIPGCTEGWVGSNCSQGCVNNTYGRDCKQTCHCENSDCDVRSGICKIPGCTEGWVGSNCSQGCVNNTYGRDCKQNCHCENSDCDVRSGICKIPGCAEGWVGSNCSQECVNNTYGRDCKQNCHCENSDCDVRSGICKIPGCTEGWVGSNCSQVQTKQYEKSPSGSSAAIGGSVAAVVAVVIVILVAYIVVRKRRNASKEGRESNNYIPPNRRSSRRDEHVYVNVVTSDCKNRTSLAVESANVNETDIDEDEVIYVNGPNDIKLRGETKILVSKLKEVVTTKHENEMYEVEFKSLPHGLKHPHETSKLTQNLQLNRFKTTFPYDHSRVILKKEKKNSTDYINANFIDGVRKQKAYIATQGPKAVTIEDFWRMTWQNNCGKIVMLANLVELGKVKCTTYWTGDDGHPLELGLFQVTMQEEMTYAFYTIRKLSVKNKETNSTRQITQYHFTRWPDHGVPEPFELLQFQKRVSSGHTKHKGPLIVHCSAGIGRTGTYIALDALLLDGKNNGEIDVFAYTETMRKDRMNMIQTAKQYEMLHYVLLEGLKVETESMSKTDFCKAIADMFEDNIPTQQYAMVNLERPEYNTSDYKTALTNKKKNRDPSILAVEKYRTRLMSTPSGYINAVNIPGYRTPYGYILTQHPLDYTVTDFLSLVAEERSGIVVSIGSLESNPSWPTTAGSQAKFGNFLITNIQCNHHSLGSERVEERQLAIENKETGADTKITLFETPSWGRTLPKSSFMMELIQTIQCKRGLDAPAVIITCRDGATESGLLCVLCNVMERLEVHGDVDIMAAVRQIQIRRPQCISSKEQYIFCYRLIQDYLEASTVYANV